MKKILYPLAMCLVFGLCLALFSNQTGAVEESSDRAAAQMVTQSLYRGAIACYASEGAYPATLEYLCDNYGINVDRQRYLINYEIFASNIMPEITVVEVNEK